MGYQVLFTRVLYTFLCCFRYCAVIAAFDFLYYFPVGMLQGYLTGMHCCSCPRRNRAGRWFYIPGIDNAHVQKPVEQGCRKKGILPPWLFFKK